jgi:RNA polymerase sigma factor (sigma-70 family)
MTPVNQPGKGKWELLLTGRDADIFAFFRLCYDDLYRLGVYLYKEPELVKESIHLLYIELWKMKDGFPTIINVREYVFTIFKRIMYKQKTGSVRHWSKIEMIDGPEVRPEMYTASYEEMMINAQEDNLMRTRLQAVLPQLGERQRELIRMRYFEEKSIDEIAELTGLTPRTIYNTLHNSLGRLRDLLG